MAKTFVGMLRKKYRKKEDTFSGEFSLDDVKQPARFTGRDFEVYNKTDKKKRRSSVEKYEQEQAASTERTSKLESHPLPQNMDRQVRRYPIIGDPEPSVFEEFIHAGKKTDQFKHRMSFWSAEHLRRVCEEVHTLFSSKLPNLTRKETMIDYIASHVTRESSKPFIEEMERDAAYNSTWGGDYRKAYYHRLAEKKDSKKTEKREPPTRARKTVAQVIAEDELVPIKQGVQHEFDPLQPPDPLFLRELYGDEQLYKALNRYGTPRLREIIAKYHIPVKRNASREEILEAIVDWAEAGGPENTTQDKRERDAQEGAAKIRSYEIHDLSPNMQVRKMTKYGIFDQEPIFERFAVAGKTEKSFRHHLQFETVNHLIEMVDEVHIWFPQSQRPKGPGKTPKIDYIVKHVNSESSKPFLDEMEKDASGTSAWRGDYRGAYFQKLEQKGYRHHIRRVSR